MKILYDHQIFSISRYGGASRYFFEIVKRIAKEENIDVSVFMGLFVNEYGLEKYKNLFSNFDGKKHKDFKKSKFVYLFLNKIFFKKYYNKVNPDIYHQTYYDIIFTNKKAKRIVTVLDMMHELFPESFHRLDKSSQLKKMAIRNADGIISISHSTKKDLIEILKIPEEKIRVIHLGNSLIALPEGEPLVKQPYFLYVAKRQGYKNFRMLLDVYSDLKKKYTEFKLVCCGGGDFTPEELELITSYNLKNDIIYFNANDDILANLYKYAVAFVYPSLYEGFGVSLLEAMNMECPVIASNRSSIPEILGDAGLYFDPEQPEDLKDKMETLINNDNLRKGLITKGLLQKNKFSWDKCADETLNYYKEIFGT